MFLVTTGDSHYTECDHVHTHQSLLLIQTKSSYKDLENKEKGYEDSKAWQFHAHELYYKDYNETYETFKKFKYDRDIEKKIFQDSLVNTLEIADKVDNFEVDTSIKLKDTETDNKDKEKEIYRICSKNLKTKVEVKDKTQYEDRLKFELSIIKEKKISNYFLVVRKIVEEAKKKMLVGCGRGSAAGSLVRS